MEEKVDNADYMSRAPLARAATRRRLSSSLLLSRFPPPPLLYYAIRRFTYSPPAERTRNHAAAFSPFSRRAESHASFCFLYVLCHATTTRCAEQRQHNYFQTRDRDDDREREIELMVKAVLFSPCHYVKMILLPPC